MKQEKSTLEIFKTWSIIRNQFVKEEETKIAMLDILAAGGFDEDDIPQNSTVEVSLQTVAQDSKKLFEMVQTLDLDVIECVGYICFKIDDAFGTEDIYFVSSTEVLFLNGGCLSY